MDKVDSPDAEQQPRRAWWLVTRRRRPEWQSLMAAGQATFSGRPRADFEATQPGDPVLLYVSKPDHSIRAVGFVARRAKNGNQDTTNSKLKTRNSKLLTPSIEVQLAFEVPNPPSWHDILAIHALAEAAPVKQRSSGTLFPLSPDEYRAVQALVIERNPELAGAFAAVDTGTVIADHVEQSEDEAANSYELHEQPGPYAPSLPGIGLPPVYNIAELEALTGLDCETLEEARDLLEDTGQIILSGPPGTGKTWLARGLAALVAGDPSRVQVAQFHPATSYEDFIEGLKPRVNPLGQVTYEVLPGLFVRMCEAARRDPEHHYVLVIDEINRAPLSRVFGELLYALEYRGPQGAMQLSVSAGMDGHSQPFYIPENLLIVGTMNSADRSLALVDYALRRRFRFIELEPSAAILDLWLTKRGNSPAQRRTVIELFEQVNRRLSESLGPDHRLGHSYFMLDPLTGATLDRLWRTAMRPLITEYFIPPTGEIEEYSTLFAEAVNSFERL